MCFEADYDWLPAVCDDVRLEVRAGFPVRCGECRCLIHPGEVGRFVFMQENDPDEWDEAAGAGDFDPGETFECVICSECQKVLDAIRAVEVGGGCSPYEAQPAFGELGEAMREDWRGGGRYRDEALALFPELKSHLWRLVPAGFDDLPEHERWASRDLEPVDELGGEG